ncbi:L-threonylcarbamoyladenylate synthase [Phaeobacter inhibens]|uniref:L-threonylcarbamoyladenylate synthase n=1 Tax=Phaeobacter inhibens TaxID=221822 RepID=UPI000C9B379F|nr:L-threonylcarbamoyladenylate synthase [Phaeobacter inhibens]AUQ61276.1 putative tRNA threonylcarbamoyladenosine biosynthesis protein [Phaeobacter inhibens]AUQ81243.1 putative tRNA threonylcarbamoyladenosine biosynthesis protein [Phaeobacter inhibens]AUQ88906.1 putative tRNA threonylcarbamoyladenosine biosynthesis protein [Phaeobacter inhibens]MDO6756481.1 L-threonylcarbamoyladenylate synthase [Phaeobacter inhibens]
MSSPTTRLLTAQPQEISTAADLLKEGQLVAFPTETVYGLGADARQTNAVEALYAAKGRPSFNPLIAHVHSVETAERHVIWSDIADTLAEAFWPGPLTLVLPLREDHGISPLVTAGLNTLGIRIPAHPAARALLSVLDGPVAAPSANPSGRISPTTAAHVIAGLGGRIAAVVDDGPCGVGVESTIIGLATGTPLLLRPGGLATEEIEAVLGHTLHLRDASDPLTAPGQLLSHYAPRASVRLNVTTPQDSELYLGFGAMECDLNLSASGDLREAAAQLFGHLHRLDARAQPIAVAPIPETGLGVAINDRLRRAAAPR